MGTEYCLGMHGDVKTPSGNGIAIMAYEMSGNFDVYVDLPKEKVDIDAWNNAARVDIWEDIDPQKLFSIGCKVIDVAKKQMDHDDEHGNTRFLYEEYLSKLSYEQQLAELKQFCIDMMDYTNQSPIEDIYIMLHKVLIQLKDNK